MPDIDIWYCCCPRVCRAAYIRLQKQKQQARLTGLPRTPTLSLSREGSLASSLGTHGAQLPATSGKAVSISCCSGFGAINRLVLGVCLGMEPGPQENAL